MPYVVFKPFMIPGCPEPNEYYRPWLELHIGEQHIHWHWQVRFLQEECKVEVHFANKEDAILFELRW